MAFALRIARIDEIEQLIERQRRASLADPHDRAAISEHPETVDLPASQIEAGDVTAAELRGERVGFSAIYLREDGDAELDGLFVEPELWKNGVGRARWSKGRPPGRPFAARESCTSSSIRIRNVSTRSSAS